MSDTGDRSSCWSTPCLTSRRNRCFAFFIVYLVSHHRPIERRLSPTRRDMREEFEHGLAGMMEVPVALDDLVRIHEELVPEIVGRMPDATGSCCGPSSIARGEPK